MRKEAAISMQGRTEFNASRFVIIRLTPPQSSSLKVDALGLKRIGTKRMPLMLRSLRYLARFRPLIHGAPTTSKGVSVPRPTLTLVVSSRPSLGRSTGSLRTALPRRRKTRSRSLTASRRSPIRRSPRSGAARLAGFVPASPSWWPPRAQQSAPRGPAPGAAPARHPPAGN